MCGFIITNLMVNEEVFEKAMGAIKHRGPDQSSGMVKIDSYICGHYRLNIIGSDELGKQPYFDEEKKYVILFNGEIYNYLELAKIYQINLISKTDTELILKLYTMLGVSFVEKLDGMFSFVIINRETNEIYYARDRLGAKPLYEWKKNNEIVLASETLAIRNLIGNDEIDELSIRQYKTMRSTFGGRTFFKNIKAVKPGSWTLNQKTTVFWDLNKVSTDILDYEEMREMISKSISYRMISDVEVGGFLSGGLDSAITTLISGVKKTWTAGFSGDEDLKYAERLTKDKSLENNQIIINEGQFLKTAREMILFRGEPLSVPNEVLIYLMSMDCVSRNIKCCISGEGADELFGGYDRLFDWAAEKKQFNLKEFAEKYCYRQQNIDLEVVEEAMYPYMHFKNPYLITSAFLQKEHLGALLKRLDSSTMLAGLEAREPFADYKLIEKMFGRSLAWKKGVLGSKTPLKIAFNKVIPDYILYREKVGFQVPLDKIFNQAGMKSGYESWFDFNLNTLGWDR